MAKGDFTDDARAEMDAVDKCLSKHQYRNKRIAEKWARFYSSHYGIEHRAYQCTICWGWHLATGGYVESEGD
jgi:hypothetical protein